MDWEQQRRKRKRFGRSSSHVQFFTRRSLFLCLSFFAFLLFLSSSRWFSIAAASFRPVLDASSTTLSRLSTSASKSTLDNSLSSKYSPLKIESRVLFPDHLLLMVSGEFGRDEKLDCLYHKSVARGLNHETLKQSVLSTDKYDEFRSIARCPLPPLNYSASAVDLRRGGVEADDHWLVRNRHPVASWERVVYEAAIDGNTVVVFAKGLNLRPHRESNPAEFSCHFRLGNSNNNGEYVHTTKAVAAAQEIIRCSLPAGVPSSLDKEKGIRVTVSRGSINSKTHLQVTLPSVARLFNSKLSDLQRNQEKHELCVCTMVWNQAAALREWIMYHAWLGVGRWFIYDNNSDDNIEEVIRELNLEDYNISRLTWPWLKTQEAGFSHCALRARDECKWVGFFDVDEFFYFPSKYRHQREYHTAGRNALHSLIAESSASSSNSTVIAEIRTACHSFGPSGLTSHPPQGVTMGYTCRLQSPERHKSFVRPDLLDITLLNIVHHFRLKRGFGFFDVPKSNAVINHYKYQVWETFRAKFFRRVATYVVDWQEAQNEGSKDRAPGLGTEAIEPPNWRLQFCEVWDTGLRDFIQTLFSDPLTGYLPWEKASG
ncbi:glycosyltransferase family 92 protein [Cucumis melo var. makuwa]|uniref:Glycosyltransferase family 92 protein n=2 Tax=Cucumis melo TaxID=3656 RepID=A0A1S3BFI1_CUCME|nr:glycosyltransferase family 92 protein RCOM_0530710 [Cucumis melo]KAA0034353.1 glycosyltransferase family 92 protein [Cucumis melo var. makuwa]TYK15566.1 glycosyltransferase family 92 protein [Cucumis melo var. makuwa]